MIIKITSVSEINSEGVEIKATIFCRRFPKPEKGESDEVYAKRVKSIEEDISGYDNLHVGWAELHQIPVLVDIPKVDEYDC